MRQILVAGNWKMNGSLSSATLLLEGIKQGISKTTRASCIVFPPFVYLPLASQVLQGSTIALGAQNVSANELGAYTGEISATMLVDFGCQYALVGHSERRSLYHEDNTLVAMKFAQAKRYGLKPILCVGETLEQRNNNQTKAVIFNQIDAVLELADGADAFREAIIAYEPVWAIGSGLSATPEQAQEIHAMIRGKINQLSTSVAQDLPILYGGSVKSHNAHDLFVMPDIDGGLIGGAALNKDEFLDILRCMQ